MMGAITIDRLTAQCLERGDQHSGCKDVPEALGGGTEDE